MTAWKTERCGQPAQRVGGRTGSSGATSAVALISAGFGVDAGSRDDGPADQIRVVLAGARQVAAVLAEDGRLGSTGRPDAAFFRRAGQPGGGQEQALLQHRVLLLHHQHPVHPPQELPGQGEGEGVGGPHLQDRRFQSQVGQGFLGVVVRDAARHDPEPPLAADGIPRRGRELGPQLVDLFLQPDVPDGREARQDDELAVLLQARRRLPLRHLADLHRPAGMADAGGRPQNDRNPDAGGRGRRPRWSWPWPPRAKLGSKTGSLDRIAVAPAYPARSGTNAAPDRRRPR